MQIRPVFIDLVKKNLKMNETLENVNGLRDRGVIRL